jgi:serine/threonine-protein kinase RsbW
MPNPDAHGDAAAARWPDTLQVSTSAQGSHVRLLRRRLTQWLGGDDLDADVIEDLVLAASEAMENCCDHAYSDGHGAGTMTLTASQTPDRLVITVADDGSWQLEGPDAGHRGRGLTLMRELVDDVAIEAGPGGTSLALTRYL